MTDEAAHAHNVARVLALHGIHPDELTEASRAEGPLVRWFIPRLESIASANGLAFTRRDPLVDGAAHFADHYLSPGGAAHAIVTVMEYADRAGAAKELVHRLVHTMAPGLPRCLAVAADGDLLPPLCFCGVDEPTTSIMFVKANLFIEIRSVGREAIPVIAFAVEVSAQIGAAAPPSSKG